MKTWIFLERFSKNTQVSNLIKIRPVGAELFNADGWTDIQTDMTKIIVLSDFNENLDFSREFFEKYSSIKFHKNRSCGSRVVQCGRMDRQTDRLTDRYD